MPELPEVETVCRDIEPKIKGKTIRSILIPKDKTPVVDYYSNYQIKKILKDKKIKSVSRRAKYIVLNLDQGHLLFHLRMTGRLNLDQSKPEYLRFQLELSNNQNLVFTDVRKFGRVYYYDDLEVLNKKLGVEPLSKDFTSKYLYSVLNSKKRQIKALLLDQAHVVGLGNIYVDEALWAAKIHPEKESNLVKETEAAKLQREIKKILEKSIQHQGTTFINYAFGNNQEGNFRKFLKVFSKEGEPCPRCKNKIIKIRVAQRGTHICPNCQH